VPRARLVATGQLRGEAVEREDQRGRRGVEQLGQRRVIGRWKRPAGPDAPGMVERVAGDGVAIAGDGGSPPGMRIAVEIADQAADIALERGDARDARPSFPPTSATPMSTAMCWSADPDRCRGRCHPARGSRRGPTTTRIPPKRGVPIRRKASCTSSQRSAKGPPPGWHRRLCRIARAAAVIERKAGRARAGHAGEPPGLVARRAASTSAITGQRRAPGLPDRCALPARWRADRLRQRPAIDSRPRP
jgi:hypothetical protein